MTGPFGEQVVPPTLSFWEGSNVTSSQLSGQDLPVAKSVQDRTLHLPPLNPMPGDPPAWLGAGWSRQLAGCGLGVVAKPVSWPPGREEGRKRVETPD